MSESELFQLPDGFREAFEDKVKYHVNRMNKTVLKATQKDAFDCAAACCDTPFTRSTDFHDCTEICAARMHDQKDYANGIISQLRVSLHHCTVSCKEDATKIYKQGKCPQAIDVFAKCALTCVQDHLFRLPQVVEEIVEQMQLRYVKFNPDVPN
ncbi:protein FAM136A-like [Macrosteles quadrilineatus]|uniref:protein FAM136A-like n=1 Tax=Macrosteles quadrilineatus TaxID=74068 RepID=UPI0023E27000|nr:protein FAM136A-like [Macrosteles quadrilineatus]